MKSMSVLQDPERPGLSPVEEWDVGLNTEETYFLFQLNERNENLVSTI